MATIAWADWLADELRAWGLTVHEVDGWKRRTYVPEDPDRPIPDFQPEGVLYHHTGTPIRADNDVPTLRTARDGRSDLPGPLYAVLIGQPLGLNLCKVYVVAAGRCNHAGDGGPFGRITSGNRQLIGVALETDGRTEIPALQRITGETVCAAILHHLGQDSARCWSHHEWRAEKPDPSPLDMTRHRYAIRVALAVHARPDGPTPPATPTPPTGATMPDTVNPYPAETAEALELLAQHSTYTDPDRKWFGPNALAALHHLKNTAVEAEAEVDRLTAETARLTGLLDAGGLQATVADVNRRLINLVDQIRAAADAAIPGGQG